MLSGADVPIHAKYPALPVTLVVGDEVLLEQAKDGWLVVSYVLGRDASGGGSSLPAPGAIGDVLTLDPTLVPYWHAVPLPLMPN